MRVDKDLIVKMLFRHLKLILLITPSNNSNQILYKIVSSNIYKVLKLNTKM